ncbi:hypothetical protein MATL_G00264670 [Megalops atlanticus]|uniref:Saposin B-type domain-containing protein n=1 Tax=Megalops atlanticus TaxID=7932 RepID=A0A9D3P9M7_MEGAT|nr:hypothetical protein MATL_G00264670 [Megalops atlanticus]
MAKLALLVFFALSVGSGQEVGSTNLNEFNKIVTMTQTQCQACKYWHIDPVIRKCFIEFFSKLKFPQAKACLREDGHSAVIECTRTCLKNLMPAKHYDHLEMLIGTAYNESVEGIIDCFPADNIPFFPLNSFMDWFNDIDNMEECIARSVTARLMRFLGDNIMNIFENQVFMTCLARRALTNLAQCSNHFLSPTGKIIDLNSSVYPRARKDALLCMIQKLIRSTAEC